MNFKYTMQSSWRASKSMPFQEIKKTPKQQQQSDKRYSYRGGRLQDTLHLVLKTIPNTKSSAAYCFHTHMQAVNFGH